MATTTTIAWTRQHPDPDSLFTEIHHFLSKHHTSSPTSTSTLAAKNILIGTSNLSPRARARAAKAGRPVHNRTTTNPTTNTAGDSPVISSISTRIPHQPAHTVENSELDAHALWQFCYQSSTKLAHDRLGKDSHGDLQASETLSSKGYIFANSPSLVSDMIKRLESPGLFEEQKFEEDSMCEDSNGRMRGSVSNTRGMRAGRLESVEEEN